jgi:hypothetical protein
LKLLPLLASALFVNLAMPHPVIAQEFEQSNLTAENYNLGEQSLNLTFADMGPIEEGGSFEYPGMGSVEYDAGTRAEDLFTVGMMQTFGFKNVSLSQIDGITGQDVTNAPLSDFKAVHNLTVEQLVDTIPGLENTPLNQVAPIQELAIEQGVSSGGGETVGSIAPIVKGAIGQLGTKLMKYGISQIPGLSKVSLGKIPGIDSQAISSIPGLAYFPLFNPLSLKDYFVKYDIAFGMSECKMGWDCHEHNIDNTASGNLQDMSIPCTGKEQSCAYLQTRRNFGNVTSKINWISKEQKVSGGSGLGSAICDKEPTGRFPLGKNPKVVLEKIMEKPGKIEFALYFSVHIDLDDSDSAHCFGPFPLPLFSPVKEKGWVLFGPDAISKNSPFAGLGGSGPSGSGGGSGSGGDYGEGSCIASDGKTSATYKGVNVAAFKNAIQKVESLGSGGYQAIGIYVNDGAGNTGRGLGKYQFMSYGPAKDIILKKPGGAQFLAAMDSPSLNKDNFSAATEKFFTPAEQESLMDSQIKHLAAVGAAQGYTGDKLIQRMAEMHEGGEGSRPGIDSRYSDKVIATYESGGTCVSGNGVATGKLRWPTKNPYITSGFGHRESPGGIGSTEHYAIDLAGDTGDPILAADGGTITFAGFNDKCGYMVTINHGNGNETKYCHASKLFVTTGSKVSVGQHIANIGSTGNSTAPHLHFVLKRNGEAIDPTPYLRGK